MSDEQAVTTATETKTEKERVIIRDTTAEGNKEKSKDLKFTKSFWLEYIQDDDETVKGAFTIKRPTIGDITRIGVRRAQLSMGIADDSLDSHTSLLTEWQATCDVCVIDSPSWFRMDDLYDTGPLRVVYLEVRKFMQTFRGNNVG